MRGLLFCPIRKCQVKATPEEHVRVALLQQMISSLGYPSELVVVERKLSELCPITSSQVTRIPNRRVDILCYAKMAQAPLAPLLLIECKACAVSGKAIAQALGYNYYIGARFVAVASAFSLAVVTAVNGSLVSQNQTLPSYSDLVGK